MFNDILIRCGLAKIMIISKGMWSNNYSSLWTVDDHMAYDQLNVIMVTEFKSYTGKNIQATMYSDN